MAWSSLASNQTVTFTNLQDAVTSGVFTLKSTITSTSECITKADANTYVNLDTAYSPYSNKTSGQLVVKSNLRPSFLYSYSILYLNANDGYFGSTTAAGACAHTLSLTLYSHNSTFTAGTRLWYVDGTEFTPASGSDPYYKYSSSTFTYTVGSGVANIASCSTTVTFTSTQTWSKPSGVTSLTVECWGGGGAGGSAVNSGSRGGGGAGGAYAKKVLTGLPSAATDYTVTVGATQSTSGSTGNPSWFSTAGTVYAQGGPGGSNATGGSVGSGSNGTSASSIGDTVYRGGNGGTGASPGNSGAGGGGAGSTGNGGDASGTTRGTGTSQNGGDGAGGNTSGSGGSAGSNYGGGGSGGAANNNTSRAGGAGAQGFVRITY